MIFSKKFGIYHIQIFWRAICILLLELSMVTYPPKVLDNRYSGRAIEQETLNYFWQIKKKSMWAVSKCTLGHYSYLRFFGHFRESKLPWVPSVNNKKMALNFVNKYIHKNVFPKLTYWNRDTLCRREFRK